MPKGFAKPSEFDVRVTSRPVTASAAHPDVVPQAVPKGDIGFRVWLRATIRSRLLEGAADAGNGSAQATAHMTVAALRSLFAELDPLLGRRAAHALYGRSLYLARAAFARPGVLAEHEQPLLDRLQADLGSRSHDDACLAAELLLMTFSDLLVTFLGEPIALRALRSAWGRTAAAEATRDTPE